MSDEGAYHDVISPGGAADDEKHAGLARYRTADSVTIPRDVFEKLYLSPEQPAAGDLRKRFGNPTPVALIGFLIASYGNQ